MSAAFAYSLVVSTMLMFLYPAVYGKPRRG